MCPTCYRKALFDSLYILAKLPTCIQPASHPDILKRSQTIQKYTYKHGNSLKSYLYPKRNHERKQHPYFHMNPPSAHSIPRRQNRTRSPLKRPSTPFRRTKRRNGQRLQINRPRRTRVSDIRHRPPIKPQYRRIPRRRLGHHRLGHARHHPVLPAAGGG